MWGEWWWSQVPRLDLQLVNELKLRKEGNTVEEEQSKWIYTQSVHMPDVGVELCTYGSAENKGMAGKGCGLQVKGGACVRVDVHLYLLPNAIVLRTKWTHPIVILTTLSMTA